MNRKLKFRVYSFLDKQFYYFDIYEGVPQGIAGGISEPQQYTGLTDSKGNKIYEGDILKIYNHSLPEKVIFLFGSFGYHINYLSSKDPRRKDNDPADFRSISELLPYELEVIGNILENPELLK